METAAPFSSISDASAVDDCDFHWYVHAACIDPEKPFFRFIALLRRCLYVVIHLVIHPRALVFK